MAEKREKIAVVTVDAETGAITFNFAIGGPVVMDISQFTESIRYRGTLHGFEQKGRDSYAGAEPAEAKGLFEKVLDTLNSGVWSSKREPAEAKEDSLDILARAVVLACARTHNSFLAGGAKQDVAVLTFEAAKIAVEGMDRKTRNSLRNQKSVAFALVEVKDQGKEVDLSSFIPAA